MSDGVDPDVLARAIDGKLDAFSELLTTPHSVLQQSRDSLDTLVVSVPAILDVLDAWESGRASSELVQGWASFVRRGYIASRGGGPIQPILIDYDPRCEDEIVEALARLDEIGDLVDGEPTPNEVRALLQNAEALD